MLEMRYAEGYYRMDTLSWSLRDGHGRFEFADHQGC